MSAWAFCRRHLLWLLASGIFATACAGPDREGVHYPITSGAHRALPAEHTTICVRSDEPVARDTAMAWLERRRYRVTGRDCALVVTVEVGREEAIRGGFTPTVLVRAEDRHTRELLLHGRAALPVQGSEERWVKDLTCQALATAWGYRPHGQLDIPSHLMCTVGTAPLLQLQ